MSGERDVRAVLDELTDGILAAIERDDAVGPGALLLLLHRFSSGTRPDVAETLGAAFARALERQERFGCGDDPEGWLAAFGEAAAVSDDSRLARAAARLVPLVRARWSAPALGDLMRSVESCLLASSVPEGRALVAEAIDFIEHGVAGAYRPGAGISHQLSCAGAAFVRGDLGDHVYTASALLTAYLLSGRLPYAMLADEVMLSVLRAPADPDASLAIRCDAARVQCRLAALHVDPEYQRAAVFAPGADYAREAGRALADLARSVGPRSAEAAPFGLAMAAWLGLSPDVQSATKISNLQ